MDILKVLYGNTFKFDREAGIIELDELTERVLEEYNAGKKLDENLEYLLQDVL